MLFVEDPVLNLQLTDATIPIATVQHLILISNVHDSQPLSSQPPLFAWVSIQTLLLVSYTFVH